MSLCFRAWGADPLRSVMAMRCCLPSMLGFLCVLWKRFVRAHLPLAGPRSFTNHVITALWFLLTKNWYNYMLEIFMFSFLGTDLSFPEISGRVFQSAFFCSALVGIWLSFIHVYKGPTSTWYEHLILLHFAFLHFSDGAFFYRWRVCSNPVSSKSISAIFHFVMVVCDPWFLLLPKLTEASGGG